MWQIIQARSFFAYIVLDSYHNNNQKLYWTSKKNTLYVPQIIDVEQGSQLVWQIRKARSCWKAVNKFFCILYLIHITRKTNTLCTLYNYWHRTRKSAGWFDKSGKARSWDGCSRHPISCLNAQYISSTVLPFKTNKGISTCRDGVSVALKLYLKPPLIESKIKIWSKPVL